MGTGYTRNDTSNNIANGNVIDADDLDGEFNAIESAFNESTGHTHDGTSAEGAPIEVTGPNQEYVSDATALYPKTDDTYDLGKTGAEWKDLYIDGTANIDSLVADTADINGGTIDGATIGGSSAGAGTFTNLTASGTVNLSGATVSDGGSVTTVDINGGTIDGTVIGGTTPAAISGTTGTFSGDLTVDTSALYVDSANNRVGIGTALSAGGLYGGLSVRKDNNSAITDGLTLMNAGSSNNAGQGIRINFSGVSETSTDDRYAYIEGATQSGSNNHYIAFGTNAAFSGPLERMRIDSSGRVGIGTSSPSSALHVENASGAVGVTVESGNSDPRIDFVTTGQATYSVGVDRTDGKFHIATSSGVGSDQAVTLDSSGRVGIGTSSPDSKFHVVAGSDGEVAEFTGVIEGRGLHIETATSPDASGHSILNSRSGGSAAILSFEVDSSEAMRIDSSGRVGIGTTSPANDLEVSTPGVTVVQISSGDSSAGYLFFGDTSDTNAGWVGYDHSVDAMLFRTNGSGEDMRIDSSGNVGIGKTNPGSAIDVNQDFEYMEGSYVAGSTSADFAVNEPSGSLFLVYLRNTTNSNYNYTALVLFNARATAFGGSQVVVVSSAQGSTGTNGEITSVSITGVNRNTLRVTSSVVGGASNTINVRVRKVELK